MLKIRSNQDPVSYTFNTADFNRDPDLVAPMPFNFGENQSSPTTTTDTKNLTELLVTSKPAVRLQLPSNASLAGPTEKQCPRYGYFGGDCNSPTNVRAQSAFGEELLATVGDSKASRYVSVLWTSLGNPTSIATSTFTAYYNFTAIHGLPIAV